MYHKLETRQLNLSVLQANGTCHSRIPIRQVWDKNKWLYEGQNGFRKGYMCKSQIVTVCPNTVDSLPERAKIGMIVIFQKLSMWFCTTDCL